MSPPAEAQHEHGSRPDFIVSAAEIRNALRRLEAEGEIVLSRLTEVHEPIEVRTLGGGQRRIPTTAIWHDRSLTDPGHSASLLWLQRKLGTDHLDAPDVAQSAAVTLHAAGFGTPASLAAVLLRNTHRAYVAARMQGRPDGHFFPLLHSASACGLFRQVLAQLVSSAALRGAVRAALDATGRLVDGKIVIPEEVVHVSEWLHVMRHRIRNVQTRDASALRVTVNPACHLYRIGPRDAIAETAVLGGARISSPTALVECLGVCAIDTPTWSACCGRGLGVASRPVMHAQGLAKLRMTAHDLRADAVVGDDADCITHLASSQEDTPGLLPTIGASQLAAMLCGAPLQEVVPMRAQAELIAPLLRKLGPPPIEAGPRTAGRRAVP